MSRQHYRGVDICWILQALAVVGLTFAALSWVGNNDLNDELNMEKRYVKNVCAGVWPDYEGLNPDCPPTGSATETD